MILNNYHDASGLCYLSAVVVIMLPTGTMDNKDHSTVDLTFIGPPSHGPPDACMYKSNVK